MSLYVIGDLHLSEGTSKPMDRFGSRWQDHARTLKSRWSSLVKEEDTVILPGDFSWAMDLEEAEGDFRLLSALPGKKILLKGNHDYWWTGVTRMKKTLDAWGIDNVDFLHNNAFTAEGKILCGSRGWFTEEKKQDDALDADFEKILAREVIRLEHSLTEGKKLQTAEEEILCFLHFPPVWGDFVCEPILKLLKDYGVHRCYFGHIHGSYNAPRVFVHEGIAMHLISSDFLGFVPQYVFPEGHNFS